MRLRASDISGNSTLNKVPPFRLIDDELGRVRELINGQLGGGDKTDVSRLLGDFNSSSGKMLRPGLVLLAGAACGKITDKHIGVAAIAEVIHNATLLHDDVIDDGQKRRGRPTVNSLWGNERAVLLGDFLLSRVFQMCADLEPEIIRAIAAATVRICEGELRQTIQGRNRQLSESEYIDIITDKSAALFSCCCYLGGLLAGAGEKRARCLADFGLNLGIAFQITDDLLDIIGDEGKTGKTLGSDVDKNKLTLALIHLLRVMEANDKSVLKVKLDAAGESKEALAEMLRGYGSLEYAHSRAEEFVIKAIAGLAELEESDAKDALIETAGYIGRRGR
ncbi:MAG TPA: polyprenyl synthetase family protein [Sedimentisphaerales bacterium]|nr:polyprenyl synthetase family protein [Sedimentisphaerales bacterium]